MSAIAVQLPEDLSQFVQETVQSGGYQTTDELFISVLSIYRDQVASSQSETSAGLLQSLRSDLQIAAEQLNRGEGIRNRDWTAKLKERHQAFAERHLA